MPNSEHQVNYSKFVEVSRKLNAAEELIEDMRYQIAMQNTEIAELKEEISRLNDEIAELGADATGTPKVHRNGRGRGING